MLAQSTGANRFPIRGRAGSVTKDRITEDVYAAEYNYTVKQWLFFRTNSLQQRSLPINIVPTRAQPCIGMAPTN